MNIAIIFLLIIYVIYELATVIKKRDDSRLLLSFYVFFTLIHFGISFLASYFLDKADLDIDSVRFYHHAVKSRDWLSLFDLGSDFISFLMYPFVKWGISIEVLFFLFATISFKGFLILFDAIELDKIRNKDIWVLLFFLMPSMHYWMGLAGKEALLLYLMALLLVKVKQKEFDFTLLIIYGFVFLIRPHLFFVLALALLFVFLLDQTISKKVKYKVGFVVICFVLFLLPLSLLFFLDIAKIQLTNIQEYFIEFIRYGQENGNSKIDLLNTTVFERIFYLLFMPLPYFYEIKNNNQFIAAIENVFFVLGLFYLLFNFIKSKFKIYRLKIDQKFALTAGLFMIVLFGSYLYNLGLGNRMRVVFLPYMLYFFISILNLNRVDVVK